MTAVLQLALAFATLIGFLGLATWVYDLAAGWWTIRTSSATLSANHRRALPTPQRLPRGPITQPMLFPTPFAPALTPSKAAPSVVVVRRRATGEQAA